MKHQLLLLVALAGLSFGATAQSKRIFLDIDHRIGSDSCTSSVVGNSQGQAYKLTRAQYYLDYFILEHDGSGVDTSNTVALVDALSPQRIDLGSFALDSITALRFAVGVNPDLNHLDPTQYNMNHPLAPKSPSMHWGWTSGYRFLAVEGVSGTGGNFNQVFQFHGLGDDNFALLTLPVEATSIGVDSLLITISANYNLLFSGINLTSGPISHGETGDAKVALRNINSGGVFSSTQGVAVSIDETPIASLQVNAYPNPTATGSIAVEMPQEGHFRLYNALGQVVQSGHWSAGQQNLNVGARGNYWLQLWFPATGQMTQIQLQHAGI